MFKKAVRKKIKLKIALTGASGSGKTYSALLLASGLGQRIAVIDTENRSSELYAGTNTIPDFDVLEIKPPYTTEKLSLAIKAAVNAEYDVLIIDSLSHFWSGDGGLLTQKEALDAASKGNSYTNWSGITKKHEQFKADILNANIHIIGTMRSKTEYVLQENERGKQAPKKIGLAPIQRDGMEYEFTTVFDIALNHSAEVSKDRTGLFDGMLAPITRETGHKMVEWLEMGELDVRVVVNVDNLAAIQYGIERLAIPTESVDAWLKTEGVNALSEISQEFADTIWKKMTRLLDEKKQTEAA